MDKHRGCRSDSPARVAADSGCAMVCSSIRVRENPGDDRPLVELYCGATIPVSQNDAAKIGSIGPFTSLFGGAMLLSVIAIELAFVSSTASSTTLLLTYAILIGGSIIIRSSATFIRDVSTAPDISFETLSIIASLESAHDTQNDEMIRQRIKKVNSISSL
jgi:hypothetical protein